MTEAFLLSWNPEKDRPEGFGPEADELRQGGRPRVRWSVTKSKKPKIGDRAFMMKVGNKGRGIIGFGTIVSNPEEGPHYDPDLAAAGTTLNYVEVEFEELINGKERQVITETELEEISQKAGTTQQWYPQNSGIEVRTVLVPYLEKLWRDKIESHVPATDEQYFDVVADLDTKYEAMRRREQSYLRKKLFGSAPYDQCCICGEMMPVRFLIVAHIKKRAECTDVEKRDFGNIVAPMCSFGCDDLFERGVIGVLQGKVIRLALDPLLNKADSYVKSLEGRRCSAFTPQSAKYFDWHRGHYGYGSRSA